MVPGCAGCARAHPDLADQSTLYQPGGTDYAHLITTGTPRFSDLQTSLHGCDHTSKKGIKCTKDIEWLRFYCSNLYTVTTGKTGNQIGSKLVSVSTQFPKTLSYFCQFDSSSWWNCKKFILYFTVPLSYKLEKTINIDELNNFLVLSVHKDRWGSIALKK